MGLRIRRQSGGKKSLSHPSGGLEMINTLVNLLGGFYENNDFAKVEAIAHSINKAVPGDEVSLKFLGLVYYRTGRTKDAIHLFNRVHRRASARTEKIESSASAVAAVAREANRRVPYLAQAWCDLGSALMKQKGNEAAPKSFQKACLA
jgi:cytochrome c-type biogenesis protein CcmH/NrfG